MTVNFFEHFGLQPTVDVDVPALEAKYRELSLVHHPDRVSADRRLEAVQKTTSLNEAVKVLKDPIRRAYYLLKLRGVDLEREDGAARASMPMEFLEIILEQREQLDLAREKKDLPRVRALAAEIGKACDAALAAGQAALRKDDTAEATAQLAKVRYYTRFLEEVDAIEEGA